MFTKPPHDYCLICDTRGAACTLSHRSRSRNSARFLLYQIVARGYSQFSQTDSLKPWMRAFNCQLRLFIPLAFTAPLCLIFIPSLLLALPLFGRFPSPFFLLSFSAFLVSSPFSREFYVCFSSCSVLVVSDARRCTTSSVRSTVTPQRRRVCCSARISSLEYHTTFEYSPSFLLFCPLLLSFSPLAAAGNKGTNHPSFKESRIKTRPARL